MDMSSIGKITETVAICPVCGDDTVGNGSKFIVEDNKTLYKYVLKEADL